MDINQLDKFPHLFPPPGFTPIVRTGLVTIPAVAAVTNLETIQITANMEGWIRWIGLEAGDFSVINFRIVVGTAPLRDYTGITVPLGSPTTPISVFIPIAVNVPLTLQAVSTGASLQPVRWLLSGWYYNPAKVGG
jgi:hypothetical protein